MWSSTLPVVDLVVKPFPNGHPFEVEASKSHPFPVVEATQSNASPEPIRVTKCPPWTAEDEFKRSGNAGKTFAYQWGFSARQRAAIQHFDLHYYDEH